MGTATRDMREHGHQAISQGSRFVQASTTRGLLTVPSGAAVPQG